VKLSVPPSVRSALDVLGIAIHSPELRRVEFAFLGFNCAEWGTWLALLVFAYHQGGTTAAGIVAFVQLVPSALFAPFGSVLADRHRPGRVLAWGYLTQATLEALTAVALFAHASPYLIYAVAAAGCTAVTVTRPTMSAFTPSLARTPSELVAVNVVSGWVESMSVLAAPILTGVMLGLSGAGLVFAVMAAVLTVSAILVFPIPGPPPAGDPELRADLVASMRSGVRVLRRERAVRLLILVLVADYVVVGALDVLYPTLANHELGRGDAWAGYLNAAFGAGAAVGVALAAGLVGTRRLLPTMLVGIGVYVGAFLVLAGTPPNAGLVLVLLAAGGAGRIVLYVTSRTLLQRAAPNDTLASVFGLLEGLGMAGLAIGGLGVAALASLGGSRLALIGVAGTLPLALAVAGRAFFEIDRRADVPVVEIGLLRGLRLFSPLAPATMEGVARRLHQVDVEAGTAVIVQGDQGDRFYAIASGGVQVSKDGVIVARLQRGDVFGEVALLRGERRNATCTAVEPTVLYALDKDDFLEAVTGHPRVALEADLLAEARSETVVKLH
jgi:MFS family permease